MIYEPAEDSFLLAKFVRKYAKNKSVLDMGTGSGILAKIALESGASRVLAADINIESINYTRSLGIECIKSNLFCEVKEKFDIIVFNPPYLPRDNREDLESQQATTGGKFGDETMIKFLKQASTHLKKHGRILLLLSTLTPRERIINELGKNRLSHKTIGKHKMFMESLEVWLIQSTQ